MTRMAVKLAIFLLLCTAPALAKDNKDEPVPKGQVRLEAQVISVDPKDSQVTLQIVTANGPSEIMADASHSVQNVGVLKPGDRIQVTLAKGSVRSFELESRYANWPTRWVALGGAFILLAAFAGMATRGNVLQFVIGADNRYSKSQVQIVVWSAVLGSAYLATLFLRVWAGGLDLLGGVEIGENLLILSGFSALTFGAAKAITVAKNSTPGASRKTMGARKFSDLVCDDLGRPDFGDFQMITITAIASAVYFWQVFHWLGVISFAGSIELPEVDTALLSSFGLGQGAYLAKKLALPVGQG